MADRIQLRRDLSTVWALVNPVLADGEVGFEKDTKKFKFGDGVSAWNSLAYVEAQDGSTLERIAGSAISGHRMVASDGTTGVQYAGSNFLDRIPIGLTLNAAGVGDPLVIKMYGEVTEPSWSWDVALPVYMGEDGVLTQTPPDVGLLVIVGTPTATDKLFVSIEEIIFL